MTCARKYLLKKFKRWKLFLIIQKRDRNLPARSMFFHIWMFCFEWDFRYYTDLDILTYIINNIWFCCKTKENKTHGLLNINTSSSLKTFIQFKSSVVSGLLMRADHVNACIQNNKCGYISVCNVMLTCCERQHRFAHKLFNYVWKLRQALYYNIVTNNE